MSWKHNLLLSIVISAFCVSCSCDHENYPEYVVHSKNGKKYLHHAGWTLSLPCDQVKTKWEKRLCDNDFKGRYWKIRSETCIYKNKETNTVVTYYPCYVYHHVSLGDGNHYNCSKAVVQHEIDICETAETEEKKE